MRLALLGHTGLLTTEMWWFEGGCPLCLVALARKTVNDDDDDHALATHLKLSQTTAACLEDHLRPWAGLASCCRQA
jgi:hypothetical protein